MSERLTELLNAMSEARKAVTVHGYTAGRTTDLKMKHLEDLFTRAANAVVDEWRAELFRASRVPAASEREVHIGPKDLPAGIWALESPHWEGTKVVQWSSSAFINKVERAIEIIVPEFPPPAPPAPPVPKAPRVFRVQKDGESDWFWMVEWPSGLCSLNNSTAADYWPEWEKCGWSEVEREGKGE